MVKEDLGKRPEEPSWAEAESRKKRLGLKGLEVEPGWKCENRTKRVSGCLCECMGVYYGLP